MMKDEDKIKLFENLCRKEYYSAIQKHNKFADDFAAFGITQIKKVLKVCRRNNDEAKTSYAFNILEEEIYEAIEAYCENRLDDCIVELAQCGAVIQRMFLMIAEENSSIPVRMATAIEDKIKQDSSNEKISSELANLQERVCTLESIYKSLNYEQKHTLPKDNG